MTYAHAHDDHDQGLGHDLSRLLDRRRVLGLLAGAGLVTLAGCAGGPPRGGSGQPGAPGEIPQETAGPFPGDGSNGPNVLTESGVVRSDIRSSIGSMSGTAQGIPLTVRMTVTDTAGAPMPGAAVYVWHCDREAQYSLYDLEDQNYLRGVQVADASGRVSFTSTFPGAYPGRWPHIHFEIYPNLAAATSADTAITTSQLALPDQTCAAVYATPGYEDSVGNLEDTSLEEDNVFSDGSEKQLATITGSVVSGFMAELTVPVAA